MKFFNKKYTYGLVNNRLPATKKNQHFTGTIVITGTAKVLQQAWLFRMGDSNRFGGSCLVHGSTEGATGPSAGLASGLAGGLAADEETLSPVPDPPPGFSHSACPPEVHRTCFCVRFIAEHTRMIEDSTKVGICVR